MPILCQYLASYPCPRLILNSDFFNFKNHFHWGHEWPGCQNLIVEWGNSCHLWQHRARWLGTGTGTKCAL